MEAHEEPAEGGLATSRLAHDPEGFALPHFERDAVDRVHEAALLTVARAGTNRKMLDDVHSLEEHWGGHALSRRSAASPSEAARSAARVAGSR